ncbi:RNase adapter RapZ [Amylibacter sp. IMCC11727]|uniref:RNase adapter RapZ n=1 Tax=Amylibacter sp. IMCC11727 TaxID=3039851 RepID=UPI00244DA983|nr:RNase adapter RapZ [Amylibacter sp. IMCC11727]WGI23559.1 RNase adapter RapZ [Amylibacter sp. IMCC11727]
MKPNAQTAKDGNIPVVLVTGPSGAGRSTAIKAFEDLGYETIDNIPLALLPRLIAGPPDGRPMALGLDVRTRDFSVRGVLDVYDAFKQDEVMEPSLLYVDCQADALVRRYSETRRRHPMAPDDTPLRGIEQEIELLKELRSRADVLIDTTPLTPHDLKAEIGGLFSGTGGASLAISVQSFSYKRGVPRGIDMVMDCRFLRNPYWDQSLREKTGQDSDVLDYVSSDPKYSAFFDQLTSLTRLLLPAYRDEGKAHFSIGLGCTGGQHRSVAVAEELAKALEADGWQVSRRHREMERRRGA